MASRHNGAFVCALMLAAVAVGLSADRITAAAPGDRTLSFYHIHTKETLTVTFKRNGEFDAAALKKVDWILRDWRKNEPTRMDPNTIDLIWEMHSELGSQQPVHIISGYRSPGTNAMLRRTRGGQARHSQHMTGKAVDITFPDVPLKRMRYSALVRERGGVGYYPTSGIPFIHVDTARVRAWPRLPRYELALLFPGGRTRHAPSSGGPITPNDVSAARAKHRDLAVQIAEFQDLRRAPRPATLVASAERVAPAPAAQRPAEKRGFAVASLGSESLPWSRKKPEGNALKQLVTFEPIAEQPRKPARLAALNRNEGELLPRLVGTPRPVERSSRFTAGKQTPKAMDTSRLAALVADVQANPPKLVEEPKPAVRPAKALAEAEMPDLAAGLAAGLASRGARFAALIPPDAESASVTDMSPESLGNGWVQAPEFDEDHPDELAYRPFPLAPLLTEEADADGPQFAALKHPDVAQTLELLDGEGAVLPMRFRPGQQVAQVLWAQQFQGKAVHVDALEELDLSRDAAGIARRAVRTSTR